MTEKDPPTMYELQAELDAAAHGSADAKAAALAKFQAEGARLNILYESGRIAHRTENPVVSAEDPPEVARPKS